jgi:4-phytase/acid phosphatase
VTMLAGLLGLDWTLRDYAAGEAAPGGGLLFELWRCGATGKSVVQVRYVAQGLDQMRYRIPLSVQTPPETVAIPVPGCGDPCPLPRFTRYVLDQVSPPPQG